MKKDRDNRDRGEKKRGKDASPAAPEVEVRSRTAENVIAASKPKMAAPPAEFRWRGFIKMGVVLFIFGAAAMLVPAGVWKQAAKQASGTAQPAGNSVLARVSCQGPIVDVTGLSGDTRGEFHFTETTCVQFDLSRGGTPYLVLPPRSGATLELRMLTPPGVDDFFVVQRRGDSQQITVRPGRGEHYAFGSQPDLAVRYISGRGFYIFQVSKPEVSFR